MLLPIGWMLCVSTSAQDCAVFRILVDTEDEGDILN